MVIHFRRAALYSLMLIPWLLLIQDMTNFYEQYASIKPWLHAEEKDANTEYYQVGIFLRVSGSLCNVFLKTVACLARIWLNYPFMTRYTRWGCHRVRRTGRSWMVCMNASYVHAAAPRAQATGGRQIDTWGLQVRPNIA